MHDAKYISERIEEKKTDYQKYDFSDKENDVLKTFFDLAQELDDIEDFYNLCVVIPKEFFNKDAYLYIVDPKINSLTLIAKTDQLDRELHTPPADDVKPAEEPYYSPKNNLVLTIRGKQPLIEELPFEVKDDVIGLLVI